MALHRIQPGLGPESYTTFSMRAPLETHWRTATCAEVSCDQHATGWKTSIDESTDLGAKQAHYIRHDRSRKHAESREGALTVFTFESGQKCFRQHKVKIDRESVFLVSGGDHRGNPRGTPTRRLSRENWVDEFASHQETIKNEIEG